MPPGPKPKPGAVSHRRLSPEEKQRRAEARREARTHCINGHDRSDTNGYWVERKEYAGGKRWVCRLCARNWQTKFHGRGRISDEVPVAPRNGDKTHCPQGHAYSEYGGVVSTTGFRYCKKCVSANQKKYLYGVTPEDKERMLQEQDGKCAICFVEFGEPHIDHDHYTGAVRGLLCSRCNLGIGMFEDMVEVLRSAARYIENHTQENTTHGTQCN